MQRHTSIWSMSGQGYRVRRGRWVRFYKETLRQEWTSLMHEITTTFGICIGSYRIGVSRTVKHFRDGKAPRAVPSTD